MRCDQWLWAGSALPHGSLRCALLRSNISLPTATCQPVRVEKPPDLGVLVCEAFRERSEQRTNKYPEVGGCVALIGGRAARQRSYNVAAAISAFIAAIVFT